MIAVSTNRFISYPLQVLFCISNVCGVNNIPRLDEQCQCQGAALLNNPVITVETNNS